MFGGEVIAVIPLQHQFLAGDVIIAWKSPGNVITLRPIITAPFR